MNAVNITLTGVSDQQSSVIHCVSEFSIIAINVKNLTISHLHFTGCGAPISKGLIDSSISLKSAMLYLLLVSNVSILHTHVYNSKGPGMLAVNTFDLILYPTSFVGNVQNCVILFYESNPPPAKLHVASYIIDSKIAYGESDSTFYGGGLSLSFFQTSYTVYVNIVNVTLYNNTGMVYGNFIMKVDNESSIYTMVCIERLRSVNILRLH